MSKQAIRAARIGPEPDAPLRVLHVEVGGSYGGSLRALDLYLRESADRRFVHDLLLYYRTPGMERVAGRVRKLHLLRLEARAKPASRVRGRVRRLLGDSAVRRLLTALYSWFGILRSLGTIRDIAALLRREAYDIVHVNNTFPYQAPTLIAAWLVRAPVLAHVRNPIRATYLNRALARLAGGVVTVNSGLTLELSKWNVPVEVRTCHDGVDLPETDEALAAKLRRSLVRDGDAAVVGSIGRLEEQKGYEFLIRAARRVADVRPDVRFVIAGEGSLRPSLEELIRGLGLTDKVLLWGFETHVAEFLRAIDVFVCSSVWEGGPMTVIEAMLLRTPVVSTGVGYVPELVGPEWQGRLVPSSDPEALANAILEVVDHRPDAARRQRFCEAAKRLSAPATNARTLDEFLGAVAQAHS